MAASARGSIVPQLMLLRMVVFCHVVRLIRTMGPCCPA